MNEGRKVGQREGQAGVGSRKGRMDGTRRYRMEGRRMEENSKADDE